ncbi:MAG: MFS transporter [Polyangiaceae bacterium]
MLAGRLRLFIFALFVSYGGFLPFFPKWLEAQGIRGAAMSALMALVPAFGVIGPPVFGALSDWLGLRTGLLRIATAGGLLATLLLAAPGVLGWPATLPILFAAMFVFALSRAPQVAMADVIAIETSKVAGPGQKAVSYGSIRLFGSVGFLIAALAVGRLLDVQAAAQLPLFMAGAMAVTFLLSFTLDPPPPPRAPSLGPPLRRLLRERAFAMLLVAAFVGFGAHVSYDMCFSLHLGKLGISSGWIGAAWAIGTLGETALMAISGWLLARVPASRLLVVAFLGGAVRWVLIGTIRDLPVLLALQPLHAISFSLFWVTAIDQVKHLAPKEILGSAQGVFNAAVGGGAVAGMFVWRAVFEARGGPTTFFWAAGASVCAALAAVGTGRREGRDAAADVV